MSERLETGRQLDVVLAADRVEAKDVLRRETAELVADLRIEREVERVLDVDLKVVTFVVGEGTDLLFERV